MTELSQEEIDRKKKFAVEYLKDPSDAFKAAISVFGDDTGAALQASYRWPTDPLVKAFMDQAVNELGDMHFLPTKAEIARVAHSLAVDQRIPVEDRLKAIRLYADIRGFIDKQGATINNNILTTNKVMLVKDHGDDERWEQQLAAQQARLIDDANASLNTIN